MTLNIFRSESLSDTMGVDSTNSFYIGHNKRSTLEQIAEFFLANTDTSKWFSNVKVYFTSTSGEDFYTGTNGFSAKMYYGSLEPNSKVWSKIDDGNELYIGRIGGPSSADTSFKKIWIKTKCSNFAEVGIYDIDLAISFVEHSI